MIRLRHGLIGALVMGVGACGEAGEAPADLVLVGGSVYTFSWSAPDGEGTPASDAPYAADRGWRPDASAVAVRGGRIVYVGDDAGAQAWVGEGTEVVELQGATVLPGLVDTHTHITELGAKLAQVDLVGVETEEEAVRRAAARARELPPGTWVLGAGWDEGAWADRYPDLERLSAAIPDHPVYLRGLHGFAGWANRRALEVAGIDADTRAPVGGEILRDGGGQPTGVFLNRAVTLLDEAVPQPSAAEVDAQILRGLEEMARSGYTGVHYAGVTAPSMEALERLAGEGALPIRVYAMLNARDTTLLARWLERGADTDPADLLQVRSVKAYYDGALGSRGARLLDDYADRPGHRGVSGEGYGFDQTWVARMMEAGFQVGVHAIGDAGNRETLDFLAEAGAGPGDRHRVEHAQVVHPDDFPRFAELGLIAAMQPPHAVEDMAWAEERLGSARIRGAYAWRTFRQHGVPVVFSSDLPGSDWNPYYGLVAAVHRIDDLGRPPGGWYPEEALTPEEAVRAYATDAAYASFTEADGGVLAPGRWADMTVLSADPLTASPDEQRRGEVVLTVAAGQVVYRR